MVDGSINVRRCEPADVPAVLELWAAARSGHASTADRVEEVERLTGDSSPAALLVAEREGEVVGALIAAWDGWRGNMYSWRSARAAGGPGSASRWSARASTTCAAAERGG